MLKIKSVKYFLPQINTRVLCNCNNLYIRIWEVLATQYKKVTSLRLHMPYVQPCPCMCVCAVQVIIFRKEIAIYPATHKQKHFVQEKFW